MPREIVHSFAKKVARCKGLLTDDTHYGYG